MNNKYNIEIQIKGLVQGVGFRPFIYRLAKEYNINGWVKNQSNGVFIKASGSQTTLNHFCKEIEHKPPKASVIDTIQIKESVKEEFESFIILKSLETDLPEITQIGPDIATCPDCLQDMKVQPHRINYVFINCTNCGPRFSIVKNLPYDRIKTTMKKFPMCAVCEEEYNDPDDRRFHAQPVACLNCGPKYKMFLNEEVIRDIEKVIDKTTQLIDDGKTVAIKGIGGYFLACDAFNKSAVSELREKKGREGKPFAVMMKDIETVEEYCQLSSDEKSLLESWRRPILILKTKKEFNSFISNGLNTTGVMLPYMPFHYLLFEKLKSTAIVFTSGNISDNPIIIKNKKALAQLSEMSDAVVIHNRSIYNRTDDSLVRFINSKSRILRRSRGYAPTPVKLNYNTDKILAMGGELKNTFCLGRGNDVFMSQHIGDLKDPDTLEFYQKNIRQFIRMFKAEPELVAHDLHPDYFSTRYASEMGLPGIPVQHHHAHIAACMAEHNLDEKVIGVSFDGTGYGDDANIWGSEFLLCDLEGYERLNHFEYIPMPGGDLVTKEPWRMGVSYLYDTFGEEIHQLDLPILRDIPASKIEWLIKAIDHKINCPLTCGSGRLFDAVSSILGICLNASFEAEAPMRLENIISTETKRYPFVSGGVISFKETIKALIKDIQAGVQPDIISGRFHNTIVSVIVVQSIKIRQDLGINKVVLSGGTFQNKYLLERTEFELEKNNFQVYSHLLFPSNDGGISLGQMAVAAKKREKGCV